MNKLGEKESMNAPGIEKNIYQGPGAGGIKVELRVYRKLMWLE